MDRRNDAVWLLNPEGATEKDFERALVHWDELDEASLRALSDHPLHGRQLDELQLAEAWLEDHLEDSAPPAVAACPSADELYDYARGPGATPLASDRRAQVDRHLVRCRPCEGVTRELRSRPPVPIEDLPSERNLDELDRALLAEICSPPPIHQLEKRSAFLRWAPLAAAAASLAIFAAISNNSDDAARLPGVDLMRGADSGSLLSPAGVLLWTPLGTESNLLEPGCTPLFALAPVAGATEYVVEIERLAGGALERGVVIETLRGASPDLGSVRLEPGRYTWRARAMVNGLDTDLGAREIEVVTHPELLELLDGKGRAEAVIILHEAGFRNDARFLAAGLPPSPERDAYLGRSSESGQGASN